jgi:Tfp pilus assembly protein FimT
MKRNRFEWQGRTRKTAAVCAAPTAVRDRSRGYLLVEMLVYISVLLVILTVGYAAMYRGANSSAALRHNARDIASALHAGERWRADVRNARGQPRLETTSDGQVLHLRQSTGDVA